MNQPFFTLEPVAHPAPKLACSECASESLIDQILDEKHVGRCSYCHRISMVLPVDLLHQQLRVLVEAEYDDPLNTLGWIDGEWVGEVYESYDVVTGRYSGNSNALTHELVDELGDQQWCKRKMTSPEMI